MEATRALQMNKFANLWPDELSTRESLRDLGYAPRVGLPEIVKRILLQHENRNMQTAQLFKDMDADGTNTLNRGEVERHVRKYLLRGRQDYEDTYEKRDEAVGEAVDRLMEELDTNKDGLISWGTFSEWNRRNSVEQLLVHIETGSEGFNRKLLWPYIVMAYILLAGYEVFNRKLFRKGRRRS